MVNVVLKGARLTDTYWLLIKSQIGHLIAMKVTVRPGFTVYNIELFSRLHKH
jgi:hypothetical protein